MGGGLSQGRGVWAQPMPTQAPVTAMAHQVMESRGIGKLTGPPLRPGRTGSAGGQCNTGAGARPWGAHVLGHLEGLLIGGAEVAEKLLVPALGSDEAEMGFAAAFALLLRESDGFLP